MFRKHKMQLYLDAALKETEDLKYQKQHLINDIVQPCQRENGILSDALHAIMGLTTVESQDIHKIAEQALRETGRLKV